MSEPVSIFDLEEIASKKLTKSDWQFYKGGALSENTLKNNRSAYSRLLFRPKYMKDVTKRVLSTVILGKPVSMPIGISPTAFHKLANPEGEIATVKAAQEAGALFVLSSIANSTIEDVAAAAPNARKWFQISPFRNRGLTESLIRRAEKSGFEALALTIDQSLFGIRRDHIRNDFDKYRIHKIANFDEDTYDDQADLYPPVTWDYVRWIKSITDLPIVLKGIITAEDAIKGVDAGASAILVSNHGGRQLDGVPATIEALPFIVKAVGHKVEVYMDGGIREGTDVFKALALGAKMVFVGRAVLWGLSYDGQEGVKKALQILRKEYDNTLGLMGCSNIADITKDMVVHQSYYNRL